LEELPLALIDRLAHYFETYKQMPGHPDVIKIQERFGAEHAGRLIEAAQRDYQSHWSKGN
jgi:inorganic pyrophosphatase